MNSRTLDPHHVPAQQYADQANAIAQLAGALARVPSSARAAAIDQLTAMVATLRAWTPAH